MDNTTQPLQLRNLTPADSDLLAAIGITTAAQFEHLGARKIYTLLVQTGMKPDRDLLFRLCGAQEDLDWHIIAAREKHRAKSRFADIDES